MYSQAQAQPQYSYSPSFPAVAGVIPSTASSPSTGTKAKTDVSRLHAFLAQCLSVGCLKGFKYFELYLRGREELLLRVYNNPDASTNRSGKPNSAYLARTQSRNLLKDKTQHRLVWQSTDALPPASPCDREMEKDTTKTVFLIAAYAKYKFPLVWLRTNHSKLAKAVSATKDDYPVKLDSVNAWKTNDSINLSDIMAEIIFLAVSPPPLNPFAIDHSVFNTLPIEESVVCVSALIDFLTKIYLTNAPFAPLVLEDIEKLTQRMLSEMADLASVPQGNSSPRRGVLSTPSQSQDLTQPSTLNNTNIVTTM